MSKGVCYTPAGKTFPTKAAVVKQVQDQILRRYPVHQDLSAADQAFVLDLLKHHPSGEQKAGAGVKRIWVQPNEAYPTREPRPYKEEGR
jgi:hypothetical protein